MYMGLSFEAGWMMSLISFVFIENPNALRYYLNIANEEIQTLDGGSTNGK